MDFETLCYNLYHIKKPFKKDGTLSAAGNRAYGKFISILYDMEAMGIISDCDTIINKLDLQIDTSKRDMVFSDLVFSDEEPVEISFDGEKFIDDNFEDITTMGI